MKGDPPFHVLKSSDDSDGGVPSLSNSPGAYNASGLCSRCQLKRVEAQRCHLYQYLQAVADLGNHAILPARSKRRRFSQRKPAMLYFPFEAGVTERQPRALWELRA
jgi:hypothetical protein